jgi:hypothetical protein
MDKIQRKRHATGRQGTFQDGVNSVLLIPLILLILSKLLDRWIRDYSTTEGAAHIEKNDGENRFISNKCQ